MKLFILGLLAIVVLLFSGCVSVTQIKDLKTEANLGKEVKVSGIVQGTIKLGDLSGYTIKDDSGSIGISSLDLPNEGSTITVTGILRKNLLFGYYIEEK
jgi:hypothetical protein